MKGFVAYYRVSTTKQGQSGLGLEAQRSAVRRYLADVNGAAVAEFTEIESGSRKDRPELRGAIAACKREGATLVIAKLDRLARNVHFISGLMDGGIEFVAVDNPHATRLMLHLLAAFAEHEREQISKRTREALTAARTRGVRLGTYGATIASHNRSTAIRFASSVRELLTEIDPTEQMTLRELAHALNKRGSRTFQGNTWTRMSICRVKHRAAHACPIEQAILSQLNRCRLNRGIVNEPLPPTSSTVMPTRITVP